MACFARFTINLKKYFMGKNYLLSILMATFIVFLSSACMAQIINPKETIKNKVTDRINTRVDQGVDAGLDKVEQGSVNILKRKKGAGEKVEEEVTDSGQDRRVSEGKEEKEMSAKREGDPSGPQKLESFTQYDFIPGDKVLCFEDFSQDKIGDFPALWTSNGSGEVKTVSIAPGNWLHMNGDDAVYCYSKTVAFPDNFIIEFDIIPDRDYDYGIVLTLYEENPDDPKEINDDLYPGKSGLQISLKQDGWETKGYTNNPE